MNGSLADSREIESLASSLSALKSSVLEVAICPPFTLLLHAQKIVSGTPLGLGAQDCHFERSGPFTGDISPAMLKELGCSYVIVGHSERRQGHGETNELVQKKARAVQALGMTPIVCLGETQQARDEGHATAVVERQLKASLPEHGEVVVAYEPIWAIGSGRNAAPRDIAEMHDVIRQQLGARANSTRLLYGGSVTVDNAQDILTTRHVHGALVGGASLKAESLLTIVKALSKTP